MKTKVEDSLNFGGNIRFVKEAGQTLPQHERDAGVSGQHVDGTFSELNRSFLGPSVPLCLESNTGKHMNCTDIVGEDK